MTHDLAGLRTRLADVTRNPDEIPPEHLPGLVADLARAQAALLVAASCRPGPANRDGESRNEDRLLEVADAAAMLSVTPRWLYRHAKDMPFTRPISRRVMRFSRAGIVKWLASRRT